MKSSESSSLCTYIHIYMCLCACACMSENVSNTFQSAALKAVGIKRVYQNHKSTNALPTTMFSEPPTATTRQKKKPA